MVTKRKLRSLYPFVDETVLEATLAKYGDDEESLFKELDNITASSHHNVLHDVPPPPEAEPAPGPVTVPTAHKKPSGGKGKGPIESPVAVAGHEAEEVPRPTPSPAPPAQSTGSAGGDDIMYFGIVMESDDAGVTTDAKTRDAIGKMVSETKKNREQYFKKQEQLDGAWQPRWEVFKDYGEEEYAHQRSLGPQSLRSRSKDALGSYNLSPHARQCFNEMLTREEELCGEYVVFYHSYSVAAILYEVQSALACHIYKLKGGLAPMPRIMKAPFAKTPTAIELLKIFPTLSGQDHSPVFRALAISASVSIFAPRSEAPPVNFFEQGYSCTDVSFRGVLLALLGKCGINANQVTVVADKVLEICRRHGLHTSWFEERQQHSQSYDRTGHTLQIFIKRFLVTTASYASHPFGVVEKEHMPFCEYLDGDGPFDGQARVFMHPSYFTDPGCVQMFVYSASETFQKNRSQFQKELVTMLKRYLRQDLEAFRYYFPVLSGEEE